jgi:Uma2 family endonuclease
VEKTVGLTESVIASNVICILGIYAREAKTGIVSGEQGMIRMLMGNVRMPDAAFFLRKDLPEGRLPAEAAPRLAPALAVEVLSPSNTIEEMQLKLTEYFENGVQIVWVLDPATKSVRVHDAPDRFHPFSAESVLDGGDVLPGFSVEVGEFFEV